MTAIHSKDYTMELWISGAIEETEILSEAAAKSCIQQILARILPPDEVAVSFFGITQTLMKGQGVEIEHPSEPTKFIFKPYVERH